ncbi:MAG: energy-coupling factor ABC transporter substrate-binding protein [Peptococcaceae bacterium]|jgi:cobalt/nickel transport protein|nr:energy-coupling factor ABC transporter substrate-binding protein [Peptococcaceae bacterium]MDH7525808.1 energy-coupling factor ABC transporter substrate-binding protein [Peptococcaceae bacterium]
MSFARKNIVLLGLVVVLAVFPLLVVHDSDFGGADGAAKEKILEINPQYVPWFDSIWEPPGGETESLLFAVQAALGAGFLGYYIGLRRGQKKAAEK